MVSNWYVMLSLWVSFCIPFVSLCMTSDFRHSQTDPNSTFVADGKRMPGQAAIFTWQASLLKASVCRDSIIPEFPTCVPTCM